jgi:hypothetical protein
MGKLVAIQPVPGSQLSLPEGGGVALDWRRDEDGSDDEGTMGVCETLSWASMTAAVRIRSE